MYIMETALNSFEGEKIPDAVMRLRNIFEENKTKRICVVGSSCVGKSTLLHYFPEAVDMDDVLFGNQQKGIAPLLSQEEINYACGPWTPDVGDFMTKRAKELISIEPGHPVFGTVVFPSDLVVEVTVPDDILMERARKRNANGSDVLAMKEQIESEIEVSGVPKVVLENV